MNRIALIISLLCCVPAWAQHRSLSLLQKTARQVLRTDAPLQTLDATDAYTVMGTDGAFVVLGTAEQLPAVIGISSRPYSPDNENLQWYLRAVATVGAAAPTVTPAAVGFPDSIPPMLTTLWQQEHPYNLLCPTAGGGRCLTGCVATAMAQILAYHRAPRHGRGFRTIYYPSNNTNGQPVKSTFEDSYYDWNLMPDDPTLPATGQAQQLAVATLMRDCGVAANMQYGPTSSGATLYEAAEGLRQYFGIDSARHVMRSDVTEEEWMQMVFDELSHGRPILYGGMDPNPLSAISGHAFVLHGYNADGLVYVNWGWGGLSDGYYDIALLNPRNMSFSTTQDMVVGICPQPFVAVEQTIEDLQPGTLATLTAEGVTSLTLKGQLNEADLQHLRHIAGTDGLLETLDLADVTLSDDALPEHALDGCCSLRRLVLPASLRQWGDGALAGCRQLRTVVLPETDVERQFTIDGHFVLTPDRTELIALLPSAHGQVTLPRGLQSLHADALNGCVRVGKITIPSSLTHIGSRALSQLRDLTELRTAQRQLPLLDNEAISAIDFEHCQLYVVRGLKDMFAAADGWSQFQSATFDNILEWGTTIKARNAIREQGQENPEFGYQIIGDYVEGTPELQCDATPQSPPGRYAIRVLPGTITSEAVDYVDGYLIVTEGSAIHDAVAKKGQAGRAYSPGGRTATQRRGLRVFKGRKTLY